MNSPIHKVSCEYIFLCADDPTLIFSEDNAELLLIKVHRTIDIFDRYFSDTIS